MHAPGFDALEMALVEIARPPDQAGRVASKMNDMLSCSAAEFHDVAGRSGKMSFERRPDRLVIAMEGRRIEPPIRLDPAAVPAKFDEIFSQVTSPKMRNRKERPVTAKPPKNNLLIHTQLTKPILSHRLQCGGY